jgi:hypothetical protein
MTRLLIAIAALMILAVPAMAERVSVLVLDASGSMWNRVEGDLTRVEVARDDAGQPARRVVRPWREGEPYVVETCVRTRERLEIADGLTGAEILAGLKGGARPRRHDHRHRTGLPVELCPCLIGCLAPDQRHRDCREEDGGDDEACHRAERDATGQARPWPPAGRRRGHRRAGTL